MTNTIVLNDFIFTFTWNPWRTIWCSVAVAVVIIGICLFIRRRRAK